MLGAGIHYAFEGVAPSCWPCGLGRIWKAGVRILGRLLCWSGDFQHHPAFPMLAYLPETSGCSWSEQILRDASCLRQPSYSIVTPTSVETAWWILREMPMNPLLYFVFLVHPSFWLKWKFSGKIFFFSPGSFLLFCFLKSYLGSTAIPTHPIVS